MGPLPLPEVLRLGAQIAERLGLGVGLGARGRGVALGVAWAAMAEPSDIDCSELDQAFASIMRIMVATGQAPHYTELAIELASIGHNVDRCGGGVDRGGW